MILLAFTSKYGRRINLIVSTWITVFTCILMVSFKNQYTRYAGMFILGLCFIRNVSSYILAMEISPFRLQMLVATLVLSTDVMTMPISSVYFKFISDDWRPIGYFSIAFSFMNAIACLFMPESPGFLYEKGEFQKSKEIIYKIATRNNSDLKNETWSFDVEVDIGDADFDTKSKRSDDRPLSAVVALTPEEIKLKKNPIKLMKKHPILFTNLIIVTITWIACSFNYFLLNFGVKDLGGNLFLNTSLITFAGIAGNIFATIIRKYVPTKTALII
jgi:hypothetical protein